MVRDKVVVPVPAPDILKKEAASDHPSVHVDLRIALRQLQLRQGLVWRPVKLVQAIRAQYHGVKPDLEVVGKETGGYLHVSILPHPAEKARKPCALDVGRRSIAPPARWPSRAGRWWRRP